MGRVNTCIHIHTDNKHNEKRRAQMNTTNSSHQCNELHRVWKFVNYAISRERITDGFFRIQDKFQNQHKKKVDPNLITVENMNVQFRQKCKKKLPAFLLGVHVS